MSWIKAQDTSHSLASTLYVSKDTTLPHVDNEKLTLKSLWLNKIGVSYWGEKGAV